MQLRHTRRAVHEALDLILDALEADARATPEEPLKRLPSRRSPRQPPPLRPLSEFTPEELARAGRKL